MPESYRPWIAAFLAFLYPGLGHLYLRAWLRAVTWFGVAIATVWWLIETGAIPQSTVTAMGEGGVGAMLAASRSLPLEVVVSLFVVRALNVVDAFLTARQQADDDAAAVAAGTCPECGRELDEDLDFCPWCTARLSGESEESSADATSR